MMTSNHHQPPCTITPAILNLVAEICETIGRHAAPAERNLTPRLRRENRIRTIQASLAIENSTLTVDQVAAVIEGKPVPGHAREIQEVRNAFAAYEAMDNWKSSSEHDLLEAHGVLMHGLAEEPGRYRSAGGGIFRGEHLVHVAPPPDRVPKLMAELLGWLENTRDHPLVAGCVFHYQFEFIHPFSDGNGRMGRMWQALVLRKWKPLLGCLPVEAVIRKRRESYYQVLADADQRADATPFIEFMLTALRDAIREAVATDQVFDQVTSRAADQESDSVTGLLACQVDEKIAEHVIDQVMGRVTDQATDQVNDPVPVQASDQVTGQVAALLQAIGNDQLGSNELMNSLGLTHRPTFRGNYLNPALEQGLIERTQPDSPRSPTQRYRLTPSGRRRLQGQAGGE